MGAAFSCAARNAHVRRIALAVFIVIAAVALSLSASVAMTAEGTGGRLVIVGGALDNANRDVFQALTQGLGENGRVAIIPAASSAPAASAENFADALIAYGVEKSRVDIVRLAVRDDPDTPQTDESAWIDNAGSAAEIAKIERADVIWLSGGDQARLARTLLTADGRDTSMLKTMRRRLKAGATIGGTSAGAAVMSDVMILGGDPFGALLYPPARLSAHEKTPADEKRLALGRGLGFFPFGLVDQHFGERGRLGRLAVAVASSEETLGFGIDENTALVVDLKQAMARVVGAGGVTVLDLRNAETATTGAFALNGARVSFLSAGDGISVPDLTPTIAPFRLPTVGKEYFDAPQVAAVGVIGGWDGLGPWLGRGLLDNSAVQFLHSVSFENARDEGVRLLFVQDDASQGYWGRDANGAPSYSIINVGFSVDPVAITVSPRGAANK